MSPHADGHPDFAAMDAEIARWRKKRNHSHCAAALKAVMAASGTEVTVSTLRPLVAGPYTRKPHVCPHGTRYWVEPTGEQIARWAAGGIP